MLDASFSHFDPQRTLVQRELAEIVATPTRISLYGDGEKCGYPEECRLCYNKRCFRGDISEELTMTRSILISLAVLTLSTSVALAAQRTHHSRAVKPNASTAATNPNAFAAGGLSPVVWSGGVSSSDRDQYVKNQRDSGYDRKKDFNPNGTIRTQ
jgi:hypothetical protein